MDRTSSYDALALRCPIHWFHEDPRGRDLRAQLNRVIVNYIRLQTGLTNTLGDLFTYGPHELERLNLRFEWRFSKCFPAFPNEDDINKWSIRELKQCWEALQGGALRCAKAALPTTNDSVGFNVQQSTQVPETSRIDTGTLKTTTPQYDPRSFDSLMQNLNERSHEWQMLTQELQLARKEIGNKDESLRASERTNRDLRAQMLDFLTRIEDEMEPDCDAYSRNNLNDLERLFERTLSTLRMNKKENAMLFEAFCNKYRNKNRSLERKNKVAEDRASKFEAELLSLQNEQTHQEVLMREREGRLMWLEEEMNSMRHAKEIAQQENKSLMEINTTLQSQLQSFEALRDSRTSQETQPAQFLNENLDPSIAQATLISKDVNAPISDSTVRIKPSSKAQSTDTSDKPLKVKSVNVRSGNKKRKTMTDVDTEMSPRDMKLARDHEARLSLESLPQSYR